MSNESKPERVRAVDPRPARTRQAVIDAMERLAEDGREHVTVLSLAKEARISRAAFYTHFTDLEDVAVSALVPALERLAEDDQSDAESGLEPAELQRRNLYRLVDFLVDRAQSVRVVAGWKVSGEVAAVLINAYAARFEEILVDRPETVLPVASSARAQARFFAGGTLTTLLSWLMEEPVQTDDEIRRRGHGLVDYLLDGLISDTSAPTSNER